MGDIGDERGRKRGSDDNEESSGCHGDVKRGKASTSIMVPKENVKTQYSVEGDSSQLQDLFPEELWEMILEKVQDPQCLENCVEASPFFSELLESRRVEYLFPKVLPILVNWCVNDTSPREDNQKTDDSDSSSDEDDISLDEALGRSRGTRLNMQDLRLVCHCWIKAVESFNVEHPFHFKIDQVPRKHLDFMEGQGEDSDSDTDSDSDEVIIDEYFRVKNTQAHLSAFKAREEEQVDDFVEEFENSPENRNPLFHRTLVIQDGSRAFITKRRVRLFWQSVTTFLQIFGDKIWYCEIRLQNNIMGYSYYFIVRQWLELMKNLRVLHWTYPQTWEDLEDSEGDEFGSRIPIFLKCKLEDKVREYPLPKLEHLQMFKTDDLPYPIFREFIKRNDHISKLQFHRKFPPPPEYKEFYEYDFANGLTNVTDLSVILWRRAELRELETSTSTWPLLKKLNLYWGNYRDNDGDYEYKVWGEVFNAVKKKCSASGTFTNLTLHLSKPRIPLRTGDTIFSSRKSFMLSLPFLKILNITIPAEGTTLDFLLPLKGTLEELNVILECGMGWDISKPIDYITEENQVIQFIGFYDRMLTSNIWRLFSNLRRISLKCLIKYRSYPTRLEYLRKNVPADVLRNEAHKVKK